MAKDFLNEYKKNKTIWNITIVVASLIIALSINFLVLDNSDFWTNLKTSVIEAGQNNQKADLILENQNWNITLKNSKKLNNTKSLSYSIIYNPENVEIKSIECNSNNLVKIENQEWIKAIIINYDNPININKNTKICTINTSKKELKSEQLNLINSNFTDTTWETYLLTTSWITF